MMIQYFTNHISLIDIVLSQKDVYFVLKNLVGYVRTFLPCNK